MNAIRTDTTSSNRYIDSYIYEAFIVLIMLNSLGFPGNFTLIFGDSLGTLVDYSCFLLEIVMMIISSAGKLLDVTMINLKSRYTLIYFFLIYTAADSMMMAALPEDEVITLVRLSVTALFALWICDSFEVDRIVEMLCLAHAILMVATLIFMVLYPSLTLRTYSEGTDFIGLFDAKNNCATELALGLVMQVVYFRICRQKKKAVPRYFIPIILLEMIFMIRCESVGAFFIVAIAVIYIAILQKKVPKLKRIPLGWFFTVGSVGFLILAVTVLPVFTWLFDLVGKDATLTGRVPLWEHALRVMAENNPLTGYGYGMFWRNEGAVALIQDGFNKDSFLGNLTTGSHNLMVEMWMSVGLIGLMLFFMMILNSMKKTQEMEESAFLFSCGFFLVFTVKGLTERLLCTAYTYDVLLLFLCLGIGCSKRTNRKLPWKRKHCQTQDEDSVTEPESLSGERYGRGQRRRDYR